MWYNTRHFLNVIPSLCVATRSMLSWEKPASRHDMVQRPLPSKCNPHPSCCNALCPILGKAHQYARCGAAPAALLNVIPSLHAPMPSVLSLEKPASRSDVVQHPLPSECDP